MCVYASACVDPSFSAGPPSASIHISLSSLASLLIPLVFVLLTKIPPAQAKSNFLFFSSSSSSFPLLALSFFYRLLVKGVKIAGDNPSPPIRGPPPAPFFLPLMLSFCAGQSRRDEEKERKREKRVGERKEAAHIKARFKRSLPFKSDRGGFDRTAPVSLT